MVEAVAHLLAGQTDKLVLGLLRIIIKGILVLDGNQIVVALEVTRMQRNFPMVVTEEQATYPDQVEVLEVAVGLTKEEAVAEAILEVVAATKVMAAGAVVHTPVLHRWCLVGTLASAIVMD